MASSNNSNTTKTNCGNVNCQEIGKLKCSACNSISYCSSTCQKTHWPSHKALCRQLRTNSNSNNNTNNNISLPSPTSSSSSPSTNSTPIVVHYGNSNDPSVPGIMPNGQPNQALVELGSKFNSCKIEVQKLFQLNDFANAIKVGKEAVKYAAQLPEPFASLELSQLHMNLSSAYIQTNNPTEAEKQVKKCLEIATRADQLFPNKPEILDALHLAQLTKAFWLINNNNLSEAEIYASRALKNAEFIYKEKNDVRMFKAFRCFGIIRDKQGQLAEAEEFLSKAYKIQVEHSPVNTDSHMVVDELIQFYIRNKNLEKAEHYAKHIHGLVQTHVSNIINVSQAVDANVDPRKFQREHLLLSDTSSRLAAILCQQRTNREEEAEVLMRQALSIREKYLGVDSKPVAMSLMAIAGVSEVLQRSPAEIEKLLVRAHAIFSNIDGPSSFHANNVMEQLKRLRGGGVLISQPGPVTSSSASSHSPRVVEVVDDDDDDIVVTSENSLKKSTTKSKNISSTSGHNSGGSWEHAQMLAEEKVFNETKLDPKDGQTRMYRATRYYEYKNFAKAEVLLVEAYTIYLKEFGPDDQNTKTAKQNLEVVRHQGIAKLWGELVEEMNTLSINNEDSTAKGVTSVKAISPEEAWLLKEPAKPGCVIC